MREKGGGQRRSRGHENELKMDKFIGQMSYMLWEGTPGRDCRATVASSKRSSNWEKTGRLLRRETR